MSAPQTYRTGEVMSLVKQLRSSRWWEDLDGSGNEYGYELLEALSKITKKFATLTPVYLIVLLSKNKGYNRRSSYKHKSLELHEKVLQILFEEDMDKLPLRLNEPFVGLIAKWRLTLGK